MLMKQSINVQFILLCNPNIPFHYQAKILIDFTRDNMVSQKMSLNEWAGGGVDSVFLSGILFLLLVLSVIHIGRAYKCTPKFQRRHQERKVRQWMQTIVAVQGRQPLNGIAGESLQGPALRQQRILNHTADLNDRTPRGDQRQHDDLAQTYPASEVVSHDPTEEVISLAPCRVRQREDRREQRGRERRTIQRGAHRETIHRCEAHTRPRHDVLCLNHEQIEGELRTDLGDVIPRPYQLRRRQPQQRLRR